MQSLLLLFWEIILVINFFLDSLKLMLMEKNRILYNFQSVTSLLN